MKFDINKQGRTVQEPMTIDNQKIAHTELAEQINASVKEVEPVAWCSKTTLGSFMCLSVKKETTEAMMWPNDILTPLYTHPANGLTAEFKAELLEALRFGDVAYYGLKNPSVDVTPAVIECRARKAAIQAAIEKLSKLEVTK